VEDLNAGALPVPITLISQNTVGASLGQDSLTKIIEAGLAGLVFVILFMLFYYRMAGLVASLALLVYAVITLAIFKLLPVTLTLSGIAGFVLSVGMAVDANILIFERMKEELRADKTFSIAVSEGFKRAWTSIRDSNFSTLISSLVLYSIGQDFVKGFALTLGLGVLVSMFTAVVVSHHLLEFFIGTKAENNKYLWRR
jgi:preprotein translocase subunit SecD